MGEYIADDIKVLDCTLRDGYHVTGGEFSPEFVSSYLHAAVGQGVDIIEIGYRSTPGSIPGAGLWRYSPDEAIERALDRTLPHCASTPRIAVMADIGKIALDDFGNAKDSPVDLVRVAFYRKDLEEGIGFAKRLKEKGYEIGVNFMAVGEYPPDVLAKCANRIAKTGIDVVYFADSFGSLDARRVRETTAILLDSGKPVGFHGHNNLQRALCNAHAAMEMGASYIDGTIYGMGRGAGNVPTELLLPELGRKLSLETLLHFIELQQRLKEEVPYPEFKWGYDADGLLTGLLDIHPNFAPKLREKLPSLNLNGIWRVLRGIPRGSLYSNTILQEAMSSAIEPQYAS